MFFFKQKTAYEMRISDWSSDVCSSDLELFDLERVRHLDNVAVAIEHTRLPLRIAPSLREADLSGGSLYEALRSDGVIPAYAEYVLRSEERRVGEERVSTCRSRW